MKIIDGRALAEKIKDGIVREIAAMDKGGAVNDNKPGLVRGRPNLAIVIVGEREDSELYVKIKEEEAKKVGIDTHIYRCAGDIPEREVFDMIGYLNRDDLIDAILIQLPLPAGFDTDGIIRAIDPAKDADRFHPDNIAAFLGPGREKELAPPLFGAVFEILNSINCDPDGKWTCIISNSDIFGESLKQALIRRGARTEVRRAGAGDLKEAAASADILITAAGRKHFIKKDMVKKDAVVIDIGIVREGGRVYGDVDMDDAKDKAGYITPVPGGIGPLTVAMLFRNTLELYKKRRGL